MKEQATDTAHSTEANLGSLIARLAHIVHAAHYPAGDRAALRRWAPAQPLPLAFYRLWLRQAASDLPSEEQTQAWMTILWSIATLGAGGHVPKRSLGQALAESDYSEGRLEQLLGAPEDKRVELLMSAVRFVAAKGNGFDLADAASFLLTTDPDKRERLHRRLAIHYYRHKKVNRE